MKRFPSIAVRLKGGLFWYYLEEIPFAPEVRQEKTGPLRRMGEREVSQCAFRVLYYKNRISAEFFHALTYGNGGLVFLKTLAAEYLFQRYGAEIPCEDGVLSRREAPKPGETEDSFLRYAGEMGSGRSEPAAYRARGVREPDGFLHVTCGTLESAAVCAAATTSASPENPSASRRLAWLLVESTVSWKWMGRARRAAGSAARIPAAETRSQSSARR